MTSRLSEKIMKNIENNINLNTATHNKGLNIRSDAEKEIIH